ncbi:iron-binding protein [Ceratobasidium sp. 370]|nr:iron-binding protein [Ceratobasidium sp. 370]
MQVPNSQRPCYELCWVVVRMTALGYRPSTIEACTGVTELMVHNILKSFSASGYSIPVASPTLVQSLYPPPSAHPRAPGTSTRGAQPVQVVAPPPPAQAAAGQATRVQPANASSHILYQSSPNRRPSASPRQVSVVQNLPPVPTDTRPAPPVAKWSPVKFPGPIVPAASSVSASKIPRAPSAEQVVKAPVLANLPDPARVKDQEYSQDVSMKDIQVLRNYLLADPSVTLSDLCAGLLRRRVEVSPFKLARALRSHKIKFNNPSKQARDEYALRVGELELEQLVFIGQISVARAAVRRRVVAGAAVAPRRAYHEKVISHYERPRNVGSLPKTDADVGTGLVGAPACGDVMKLQIRVDERGIISDVKFKTFGCGSAIASSSYMTERVKGLSLEEAGQIKNTEIARELSLPPVKLHCSMLAEDAIRSAIRDYRSKRSKLANPQKPGFIDVSQSAATGETVATAHPGQA